MEKALIGVYLNKNKLSNQLNNVDNESKNLKKAILSLDNKIDILIQEEKQNMSFGIIHLPDNNILIKIFSGLKLYLNINDSSVAPHIALDGIWEPHITKAWLSVIKPDDVVFDIGANFGYYGLLAAQIKKTPSKSKVYFFEANRELIPYIKRSLSTNWLYEFSVVENLAVVDTPRTVTLNIIKDHIGSSSLHSIEKINKFMKERMDFKLFKKVKVSAVSLDDYCKRNHVNKINLIKMDIEGYEENAYQGMRNIVKNSPKLTLFIEFTSYDYEKPEEFYNRLLKDFGNVYTINSAGDIVRPNNTKYESVVNNKKDWIMLIFSKNNNL